MKIKCEPGGHSLVITNTDQTQQHSQYWYNFRKNNENSSIFIMCNVKQMIKT